MIIYGTKGSEIGKGRIRNVICPHCEANTEMNYTVFGRYAHIYWLPFFPIGRVNILECNSCKSTFDLKNLAEPIQQKFKNEKGLNPIKTPITHFSMGILAVIGIGYAVYSNFRADSETSEFAKNPKVGDVFYETTTSGKFSTSRITRINKDSIFVLQNTYESESRTDVDEQSADEENYKMPYAFLKKKYAELALKGDTIYKITRK